MKTIFTGPAETQLELLCPPTSARAQALGHMLGPWAPGEEAVARAANCVRCGRIAYVRAEAGLMGAAGPALTDPCDGLREGLPG